MSNVSAACIFQNIQTERQYGVIALLNNRAPYH